MYMIHMELKFVTICHFYIHFYLTAISEVDEMYENAELNDAIHFIVF